MLYLVYALLYLLHALSTQITPFHPRASSVTEQLNVGISTDGGDQTDNTYYCKISINFHGPGSPHNFQTSFPSHGSPRNFKQGVTGNKRYPLSVFNKNSTLKRETPDYTVQPYNLET